MIKQRFRWLSLSGAGRWSQRRLKINSGAAVNPFIAIQS
jgi:hypothetical protein